MDSGEFNKIAGAGIGALLLFLLLGFFSELLYKPPYEGEVLAYAVEIEEAAPAEEAEEIDLAALVASAEPSEGERLFRQCAACHKLEEGANAVGPYLWGVVGRDVATASGYSYSDALASIDGAWDLEHLNAFLEDPKGYAPGTKMAYGGMDDPQDRVNLIAYLNEVDGSPMELAAAPTAEAAAPAEDAQTQPVDPATPGETQQTPAEQAPAEAPVKEPGTTDAPVDAPAPLSPEAQESAAERQEEAAVAPAGEATGAASGVYASVTAKDGEKIFRRCRACHKVDDGANGVGPHLFGVVGREIGTVDGYSYSDALASKDGAWTAENLSAFLKNPKDWAPGTKMAFAGLRKEEDRAAVIVYLNEADGSPEPLE